MTRGPQIVGDIWFNTPRPLTPEDLNGRVVLVDFWTYSCVNCIRTIPYLAKWWERYKNLPFFIIGIHTPEFEFEKNPRNVEEAMKKLGVEWPVVLDNDYKNWHNFANHYWPAKYLLDQNGYIIYEHYGEGAYGETERRIQETLRGDSAIKNFPPVFEEEGGGGVCFIHTPELYCGYLRGNIANRGGYHIDHLGNYTKPDEIPMNSIALLGQFNAQPEYVESFLPGAELDVRFQGTEVNLVMAPANSFGIVSISFNGETLPGEIQGADVDQGDVIISKPRMYNLIKSSKPLSGLLSVKAKESNFKAYAFTFLGECN